VEDGRGERPGGALVLDGSAAVVSPANGGSVASLEAGGGVVPGGWCTSVTGRLLRPTPDETVNRPANTRTVNAAAATTAAVMIPAPTTKALRFAVRLSS
jgi:hypothetical protein